MAISKIQKKLLVKSIATTMTVSLAANEVKYFDITPPSDANYKWLLINVSTNTVRLAYNDGTNSGIRIKNWLNTPEVDQNITLIWLGFLK